MLIYMSFLIPVLHYLSNTFLMYFAKVSNHNGLKKKNFFVGLFFPDTKKKCANTSCCCSVAQSCPTLCDSMDCSIHRLPCPSLSPGACSNPCPLGRWCHPTISSSVVPFSFCLQSFPAPAGGPIIQFNSDNIYLEIVSGPAGEELTPTGYTPCIPLQDTSHKSSCHLCFQPLAKD